MAVLAIFPAPMPLPARTLGLSKRNVSLPIFPCLPHKYIFTKLFPPWQRFEGCRDPFFQRGSRSTNSLTVVCTSLQAPSQQGPSPGRGRLM
ncbi:hypothetical protein BJY01DRAFT_212772 [Aspergillus pseudoustus]|uniref:Uncharacterized protein n=1 Tax=Aspergillus pseudoustus TaxID=1810923 RepID=A0ABR4K4K5_9EURO